MKSVVATVLAGSLVVAGCASTDPHTGEKRTSRATLGAVFGALGGAAIGALTNTSSGKEAATNALIGAGIGALAGGAAGAYMDQQAAELEQELRASGVRVERVGPNKQNIRLVMDNDITFATDSSDINSQFFGTLTSVGKVLKKYEKTYIEVDGHTDSTGSDGYNLDLSQRRANSVAEFLINQPKIVPGRLIVNGWGEKRPIADNRTQEGRQMNRRVEIQISPYVDNSVS